MHSRYKIFLLTTCLLAIFAYTSAQVTSSPYSSFGMGNIEESAIGANKAMGATGIALMSTNSINLVNPASYDGIDTLTMIFEMGLFGKETKYTNYLSTQKHFDANFKYLDMGFKITSKLGTSFGINSYSAVGYNITENTMLVGTSQYYNKILSGDGGVNKAFVGASYRIFKNLSVGANFVYLFGNVTHMESSQDYAYELKSVTYLSNIDLNYGLNYKFKIQNLSYNIGFIYDNGKKLTTSNVSTITTAADAETLRSTTTSLSIPRSYGLGFAVTKNYFRAGLDLETKECKNFTYDNGLVKSRNTGRISAGIEFPSFGDNKGTSRMIFYRLGAEYNKSNLIINGVPINYRSVTIGAGLPFHGALDVFNLSLELGQNGSAKKGLFKETFCNFHLDISLKENWFIKRKYF